MTASCKSCLFSQNDALGDGLLSCKRFPPVRWRWPADVSREYPEVWPWDWCGEFKSRSKVDKK
jgi:hypothetical protein